jgi:transposase
MRGDDKQQAAMFSYVTMEQRISPDHPIRRIRSLADRALARMDAEFDQLYSEMGRPSIAPERLLRTQLLMVLYSIRSENQLMEQLNYNLLYRWFVGLEMDDPVWDQTVFSKNRERLIAGQASRKLLLAVLEEARAEQLLSEEHFTVDGTLIQAWALIGEKCHCGPQKRPAETNHNPGTLPAAAKVSTTGRSTTKTAIISASCSVVPKRPGKLRGFNP